MTDLKRSARSPQRRLGRAGIVASLIAVSAFVGWISFYVSGGVACTALQTDMLPGSEVYRPLVQIAGAALTLLGLVPWIVASLVLWRSLSGVMSARQITFAFALSVGASALVLLIYMTPTWGRYEALLLKPFGCGGL